MKNIETVIMRLKELKSFGISISIDDFGIGYSSLQYLQRLPINSLKIDRSFVNMIESDNPSLLMTILQLGRNFNLRIVAEGIETQSQLDFLSNEGCDEAQGYYFAKPLPASQFEKLWLRHR
jgi:EAL domain-containing protein (putative c-di-GMP-specific phosphodiesterase class I)